MIISMSIAVFPIICSCAEGYEFGRKVGAYDTIYETQIYKS